MNLINILLTNTKSANNPSRFTRTYLKAIEKVGETTKKISLAKEIYLQCSNQRWATDWDV